MNEKEARVNGLVFGGPTANPYNKEEVAELKAKAAKIRKMGFTAVVVQSGAKEWGGGSKLLYVDHDYDDYKYLLSQYKRADESLILAEARRKCDEIMLEATASQNRLNNSVADIRAKLLANGHKNLEGLEG